MRRTEKLPFDIHQVIRIVREAVRPFPRAAMFELADEGHTSAFEQLIACMISIRTRDETMLVLARRFFARARTPAQVAKLSVAEIDALIGECAFHEAKARQIKGAAEKLVAEHGGELPCDEEVMLSLRGVGPKCTNLVMGVACGATRIGVDIHVHRVTNRWGYVRANTPTGTMSILQRVLPREYWVEINRLLVPFGKHICTGRAPKCTVCPLLPYCRQVGVTTYR